MTIWAERDLVVLRYLHEHPRPDHLFETNWISDSPHQGVPELSEKQVHVSVETLLGEGLLHHGSGPSMEGGGGVLWVDLELTGAGLQTLGEWPIFEALGSPEALGHILDVLADMATNDDEESNLRRAANSARAKGAEALHLFLASALMGIVRQQIGG